MVKLGDDAKQKLWIEIASQVLNGFFTLANVPVHPKRLIGFIRGFGIWRQDKAMRQQFVDQFLKEYEDRNLITGSTKKDRSADLLKMLDFYRCFPEYGRDRQREHPHAHFEETFSQIPSPNSCSPDRSRVMTSPAANVVVTYSMDRSGAQIEDQNNDADSVRHLHPSVIAESSEEDGLPISEGVVRVDIAEEDLNDLLAMETHRVAQSVVLPFLPFPFGASSTEDEDIDSASRQPLSLDTSLATRDLERGAGATSQTSPTSPQFRRTIERGSSYASLPRTPTKRISPRTRARTTTMSMMKEGSPNSTSKRSTFVVHEDEHLVHPSNQHSALREHVEEVLTSGLLPFHRDTSTTKPTNQLPPLIPMPPALTKEQMDWVDERQARLLKQQGRLQKAWPWYNYTIPSGIEPVDFFAHPSEQPVAYFKRTPSVQVEKATGSKASHPTSSSTVTRPSTAAIMLRESPTDLVVSPARYCLIVGSFNINSMVQEMLCGFMWGMNYHVRPGWVVGTGMALGCIAAIVPSILIMLHEQAMSRVRVVATAEEAIQDALDEKINSAS
ncbi:hypothetical protein BGZ58_007196 [Dissophora ornata]|nr:hypothetical protein BGZ58_007196 [Dissophora ornata]